MNAVSSVSTDASRVQRRHGEDERQTRFKRLYRREPRSTLLAEIGVADRVSSVSTDASRVQPLFRTSACFTVSSVSTDASRVQHWLTVTNEGGKFQASLPTRVAFNP